MVGMAIGAGVGIGVGVASAMGANVPAMLRCLDPTALGLVLFNYNPTEIKIDRAGQQQTQGSSRGGATPAVPAKVNQPTISLNKVTLTGDLTKMNVDTLLSWCAPPQGLFTAIAGALGAVVSTSQPIVTFQWGPPMVGFMYDVILKQVTATYKRFHSSGIPIRAEVNITMLVQPSIFGSLPTNPTSGGQPGRGMHMVRDGESLQSIAQQHYGRPGLWRKIAEINGITDPQRVRPGTNVYLPGPGELTASR